MQQPIAVIDLGTNTFHLLIVRATDQGEWDTLFRKRTFVRLAEKGIRTICPEAIQRALSAMREFAEILSAYELTAVQAFGTAALRTATNGLELAKRMEAETGIPVRLIDGLDEARLIHAGVRQVVPFDYRRQLIMDVGGGSVEFIIADEKQVFWSQSFLIGVGVLFCDFHRSDPIHPSEVESLKRFLHGILGDLRAALQLYPVHALTGASGAFETISDLLQETEPDPALSSISTQDFRSLYQQILPTTVAERRAISLIPEERIEMIIVSMVLIDYILDHAHPERINISRYAMKEGMILNMLNF